MSENGYQLPSISINKKSFSKKLLPCIDYLYFIIRPLGMHCQPRNNQQPGGVHAKTLKNVKEKIAPTDTFTNAENGILSIIVL
jgi:hypothetical protein